MPFKIIETIEKGQKRLCIIPSLWESNGTLRWPRKRLDVNKLVKDENSLPLDNWSISYCCVKRQTLSSYEEATRELDLMVQNSDTEIDNETIVNTTSRNNNYAYNCNNLAEQLALNQPGTSSTILSTPSTPVLPATATEYIIQYVADSNNLATVSVNTQNNDFETPSPTQTQQNNDVNLNEHYLKLILDNQINMSQTISTLMDNQKKILHKLASLSVQMEYEFSKCDNTKSTDVVRLNKSNSFENEKFTIKPVDSVKELEELESLLSDRQQKSKLLKQYAFVCSQSNGKGVTCAYKVLDMFFTRDFICKCSWTGGSRKGNDVKIPLKAFKNVLIFFYELIRIWDQTYTTEDNENFFKIVLKNSVKRKLSKNERASTKRRRTKKVSLKNSDQTNKATIQTENVVVGVVVQDERTVTTKETQNSNKDAIEEREQREEGEKEELNS